MKTLLDIIHLTEAFFTSKKIDRPKREAEEVIADVLKLKRLDLYLQFERPLIEEELNRIRNAIKLRGERIPKEYISGQVSFAGSLIKVTPSVLIPRPETELLVESIVSTLQTLDVEGKVLWDVASGSGCIGISLKRRFPKLHVICSDLSKEALKIATENSAGLEIEFLEGDLFNPFKGKKCDFFVSNPPYVTENEYENLSLEVKKEPKMALVSGPSGLEFYERIAKNLKNYLNPAGKGWLELGTGQGSSVKSIFENQGFRCHFQRDFSGHDRFFFLERD